MAGGNIKGITIEFAGDTSKLEKSIRQVTNSTKSIDKELKNVNRALKFNPSNVDLWRQKQTLLSQKITESEKKLKLLKQQQKNMDAAGVSKNSEEYRKLQREIIETESKLKRFKAQLKEIGNVNLRALGEKFKQVGQKMTDVGKSMTTKVTVPIAAAGAVAAKKFAEVDKTMQLTNKTMGNSKAEADMLNKAMKSAAASSTYGMNDAATASLNFARAGLSAEQAASALAPSMALAAGEGGELDTVSAGLVATINGFHGSFEDASKYADVFANACNNSALDVDSLSKAMSVAAPIFSSAGYSVNDAALYMGVMANNGIEADKAANSLKTGLARLVSPAKEGAEMMDKLGINVTNADGTMKDSVTIQKELHDAFGKLSESEQIAAASAIFGKNQMAPWLALINTAPEDVGKLDEALGKNGTAMEMQGAMMSGFAGSIEQLKSGIDVLAVSFGEALAPMIQKVVGVIQILVNWFNGLSPQMQTIIATIAVVVAAIGPLLIVLGALTSAIGTLMIYGPMIVGAIGAVVAAFGPIILIIGGVIAAGILLYKNWDKIKAKAQALGKGLKNAWNSIKNSAAAAWDAVRNKIVAAWNKISSTVGGKVNAVKAKISGAWSAIKQKTAAAWNAIKQHIIDPIQKAWNKVKSVVDKIKGYFPIHVGKIFDGIKLPRFSVSGGKPPFGIGGKGSLPHFDVVGWNKNGAIFNKPTILQGVGEAGPEAVIPLDKFWAKMDKIAAATQSSGDGVVINIYGAPGQDINALAQKVEQIMTKMQKRRETAW